MPSIDERIVQMQFDNKEFEKNVQVSIKSLEDLKKSLELDKAAKSLETIEKAVEGVDFSSLSNAVSAISNKFTNLGIVGVTALKNIANKAIDAGTQLVKSLTVDPVSKGFEKYDQKTRAVQTIVNATGQTIDEVDKQLAKLSWFTDETSYSFTDMVSNIGKFTAMNIPLDQSVTAMEGIANWAAVSGQGINEASRAMYNLSQSMGLGYVQLMDWRSIENANMATADFRKNVIETAKAMGILDEAGTIAGTNIAVSTENFASTLQYKWFDKDVLLEVLNQYGEFSDKVYELYKTGMETSEAIDAVSGSTSEFSEKAFRAAQEAKTYRDAIEAVAEAAQSQWMTTFEMIFGNYEEAKVLWTDLANDLYEIFVTGGEERNELLKSWKEIGGRDTFIEGLYNSMAALKGIIAAVRKALADIFPQATAQNLKEMTERFRDWTAQLKEAYGLVQKWAGKETIITEYKSKGFEDWQGELKNGTKGAKDQIQLMQERLEQAGYSLDRFGADGIFGPETQAAIEQFQKDMGLAITGVYDEATHNALGDKLGLTGTEKSYEKIDKYIEDINPNLSNLMKLVRGVASAVKILIDIGKFGLGIAAAVIDVLTPIGVLFLDIFGFVSDVFTRIQEGLTEGEVFSSWLETINRWLIPAKEAVQGFADSIMSFVFGTEEAPTLLGQLRNRTINLKDAWNQAKDTIKNSEFGKAIAKLVNKIGPDFDKLKEKLSNFYETTKEKLKEKLPGVFASVKGGLSTIGTGLVNFVSRAYDVIKGSETLQKVWSKLKSFIKGFGKSFGKFGKGVWEAIIGIFDGKKVSDVWDKLKDDLGGVGEFFKNTWMAIKGYFKGIIDNSDFLSGAFDRIKKVVKPAGNIVKGFIDSLIKSIHQFFGTDTSDVEGFWPKLKKKLSGFEDLKSWFQGVKDDIKKAFEDLKKILSGEGIEGVGEGSGGEPSLFSSLKQTFDDLSTQFEGIDLKGLLTKALKYAAVALLIDGIKNIHNLTSAFKNFAKAYMYQNGGGVGNIVKNIGKSLLSVGASALMAGAGVALVVLAIGELVKIVDEADAEDLDQAIKILDKLVYVFAAIEGVTGIAAGFSHGSFNFNIDGALSIGIGLWLVVKALSNLIKLYKDSDLQNTNILERAIETVQAFLLELGAIEAVSSFGSGGIKLSGALETAWALRNVVWAIGDLAKTYKEYGTENITDILISVAGLLGELGAIEVAAGHFTTNALGGLASGGGAIATAYALRMIVEDVGKLAQIYETYNTNGSVTRALIGIESLLGELAVLEGVTGYFTKDWSSAVGELTGGGGVVAVAYALQMIVEALAAAMPSIENVDLAKMSAFFGGIEIVLASMEAFIILAGKIDSSWMSALGIGVSSAGLWAAVEALKVIINSFTEAMPAIENVDLEKMTSFFAGTEIALGAMQAFVLAAGKLTTDQFGVFGELAGSGGIVGIALAFGELVKAFGSVMPSVQSVDTDKMTAFFEGANTSLLAMGTFVAGFEAIGALGTNAFQSIATLVSSGGLSGISLAFKELVTAFGSVMPSIKNVDPEKMTAFFEGINTSLVAMEAFVSTAAGLASIPSFNPLSMVAIVGSMVGLVYGLGMVSSSVLNNFSSTMWLVGGRLKDLSGNMEDVKEENITKLKSIVDVLYGSLESMVSFGNEKDKIDTFGETIINLGASIGLFNLGTAGITNDKVSALTAFANGIKTVVDTIAGITNYQTAEDVLSSIGGALGIYYGNIKDITTNNVNPPDASTIQSAFEALAQAIPEDATLATIAKFGGKDSEYGGVQKLAIGIQNLGTALNNYGNKISKLKTDKIQAANEVLDKIAEIQGKVESVNIFEEFARSITGKRATFTSFVRNVGSLGNALGSFGTSIGTLDAGQVETASGVLDTIANIKLETTGGLWQALTGSKNLGLFATNVGDIGAGLARFAQEVEPYKDMFTGDSQQAIENALVPLTALGDIGAKLQKTGGLDSLFSGDLKIADLGIQLKDFITNLGEDWTDTINYAENIDYAALETDVIPLLEKLAEIQNLILPKTESTDQGYSSLSGLSEGLIRFMNEMANLSTDADFITTAQSVGKAIDTSIGSGIVFEGGQIQTAIGTLPGLISDYIKGYESVFNGIGEFIDSGIAVGIKNKSDIVKSAIRSLCSGLILEALKALLINSPSKVFEDIGEGIDEGAVKGIDGKKKTVFDAAHGMAEESIKGMESGLKLFAESLNLPIEDMPVIRPVLDLSDVSSGMAIVNGMFGDQTMAVKSAALAGTIGRQNVAGTNIDQNGSSSSTPSSLSEAISTLNDRMASLETSIRNMKVVTETGALIGQIASGIDDKLGEFAYMNERGG